MAIIKQPTFFISYDLPSWVEPYDRSLTNCECGNLCERGIGSCDSCIDRITKEIEMDNYDSPQNDQKMDG